jgi:tetratricopeptide (TPR) repeat protein
MNDSATPSAADRLHQHLAEAAALKYGDPARMLDEARAAAILARTVGDLRAYAFTLQIQAWAYLQQHRYEPALTHVTEALRLARTFGYSEIEARAINTLGLTFFRCGAIYEASRFFENQLDIAAALHHDELQASALHDLALMRMSEGDSGEETLDLMRRAGELMPLESNDGMDVSVILINSAWCHIQQNHLDTAQKDLERALEITPREKSALVAGNAHLVLAQVHLRGGDTAAAAEQIEHARACAAASTQPDILSVNVTMLTAELMDAEGRHDEAAIWWERTYDEAVRARMIQFAARILDTLQKIYEANGDNENLVRTYKRLTEEIPRLQKDSNDQRFAALRLVMGGEGKSPAGGPALNTQKNEILQQLSDDFIAPLSLIQGEAETIQIDDSALPLAQRQARLQQITEHVAKMTSMLEGIVNILEHEGVEGSA